METIKALLPVAAGILSSVLGAGPLGAILLGVGAIGLLVGGVFLYNKVKNAQFEQAKKDSQAAAVAGHDKVIKDNQGQAVGDKKTVDQQKKDEEDALKKITGGGNASS